MAGTDGTVDVSSIPADRLFIVESVSEDDPISVIEEEGFFFVIKQHKSKHNKNKQTCPKDTRRVISRILTLKARDCIKEDSDAALAQRLLTIALRYDDRNIDGINLYGKILRMANYLEHSIDMYGRCLAVDPINVEALTSRANIFYRQLNKRHEAEWHLKLAIKFHPKNLYVLSAYAGFLAGVKNDLVGAEKLYNEALELLESTKKKVVIKVDPTVATLGSTATAATAGAKGKDEQDDSKQTNNETQGNPVTQAAQAAQQAQQQTKQTVDLYDQPHILYNYALFLAQQKHEFEDALKHLKKYLLMRSQDAEAIKLYHEIEDKMNSLTG